MKKRVSPFIVALPAFIIVAIFKVYPIISSLVLSFFDYNPKRGIATSEFVGLANYSEFFSSYYFPRLLRNTFFLTALPAIATALLSFVAIIFIMKLPNRWFRGLALMVLAFPALIPLPLVGGVLKDLSSGQPVNLLASPVVYPWIYIAFESLRYMFYPTALGVLSASNSDSLWKDVSYALRVAFGYVLVRFAFFMFANRELTILLYNPMVYETADNFTSYVFRKGLLEGDYGATYAVGSVRAIVQLLLNIPIFFALKAMIESQQDTGYVMPARKTAWPKWIIGVAGCLLVCIGSLVVISNLVTGLVGSKGTFGEAFTIIGTLQGLTNSFVYAFFAAILFSALSVLLAYPLTTKSKAYPLILFILMGVNLVFSEHTIFRSLGLLDTGVAVVLSSGIAVWGALLIHLITRNRVKDVTGFEDYVRIIAPMIIIVFILSFVKTWGSTDAGSYLTSPHKFPTSLTLRLMFIQRDFITERGADVMYIIALFSSLPPLVFGWLPIWLNRYFFKES